MRKLLIACTTVAALALAACADEGTADSEEDDTTTTTEAVDSEARDEYVAALADEMEGDPEFPLDETQANCFAEAIVDTIGVDNLEDAGVAPAEFAEDELNADARELFESERAALTSAVAACNLSDTLGRELTSQLGVSEAGSACVLDNIDEEEFAGLLIGAALGEEDEASGEDYGRAIMANLDGACAKLIVVELLASQGVVTPDLQACFEETLDEDLAQRVLNSEEQTTNAEGLQAELAEVITACT